jgi:hypothetical protein
VAINRDAFASCLAGAAAAECFSDIRESLSNLDMLARCLGGAGSAKCFDAARVARSLASGAAPDTLLSAPTNLTAQVVGSTVMLTWLAPSPGAPVASYIIEAGSAPGQANLVSLTVGATTNLSVSAVPAGTYYVRVRASNVAGTGAPSNEVAVVVSSGCVAPSAPTLVLINNTAGNVALSWTLAAGVPTSYALQAGSNPGLANFANVNLGNGGRTFSTSGVPSGTYYVRVYARNACGLSPPSNELTIFVGTAQPTSFIRFQGESLGIGSFCECIGGTGTVITARTDGEVRGTRNCNTIDSLVVQVPPGSHTASACYTRFGQESCWSDTLFLAPGATAFLNLTVSFC